MPALSTPDGQVLVTDPGAELPGAGPPADTDQQFARALADPDPSGTREPPRHDQAPPAEAPKRRRGRPPKNPDAAPRATDKAAEATEPVNYTEAAAGLTAMCWMTLAGIPWTSAYAVVIDANSAPLTAALANGAQHNERIRALLERAASGGDGLYLLQLASVGMNMAIQAAQIMRDPVLRADAHRASQAKLREYLTLNGIKVPGEQEQAAENEPSPT